jgi:hypothetical protein
MATRSPGAVDSDVFTSSTSRVRCAAAPVPSVPCAPHAPGGVCRQDLSHLVLRHRQQDRNCQPVRLRIVTGDEVDSGLLQKGKDRNRPRKPVKLGDDEGCLRAIRVRDDPAQFRPVV